MMALKAFIISLLVAVVVAVENDTEEAQAARIIAEFQMPELLKDMIRSEVAKDCKNVNAVDKTDVASNSVIQFCDCAFRLFSEDNLSLTKLSHAIEEGKVAQFWKKNCEKAAQFRQCFAAMIDGYKACAQKDFVQSIGILKKDLESVIDFTCYNDGERLIPLTSNEVMMCFMSEQLEALKRCQNKIEYTDNYMDALRNMSSEKLCAKVEEVSTCSANALRGCNTSIPSDFLDAFAKHFQQESGSCQGQK